MTDLAPIATREEKRRAEYQARFGKSALDAAKATGNALIGGDGLPDLAGVAETIGGGVKGIAVGCGRCV